MIAGFCAGGEECSGDAQFEFRVPPVLDDTTLFVLFLEMSLQEKYNDDYDDEEADGEFVLITVTGFSNNAPILCAVYEAVLGCSHDKPHGAWDSL